MIGTRVLRFQLITFATRPRRRSLLTVASPRVIAGAQGREGGSTPLSRHLGPQLEWLYWVAAIRKRAKLCGAAPRASKVSRAAKVRALIEHGAGDLGSTECSVGWGLVSTGKLPQSLI